MITILLVHGNVYLFSLFLHKTQTSNQIKMMSQNSKSKACRNLRRIDLIGLESWLEKDFISRIRGDGKFSEAFLAADWKHEANFALPKLTFVFTVIVANASAGGIIGTNLSAFFDAV